VPAAPVFPLKPLELPPPAHKISPAFWSTKISPAKAVYVLPSLTGILKSIALSTATFLLRTSIVKMF
jgi:hypothetical protein